MKTITKRSTREALRALLRAGASEEDIAATLGVTVRTVQNWARRDNTPHQRDRRALVALAKERGVA